jgi:predicted DNA-binding transcriptional regulator AlpA
MTTIASRLVQGRNQKTQRGHVMPSAPLISLSGPGRLRTAHVLALCGISHSTLYERQRTGAFPMPDGKDGALNYWKTETIRQYLQ